MNIIRAIFGPTSSLSDPGSWLVRAVGGGKVKSGVSVSEYNALTLPAVWACVSIISKPMAYMPAHVIRSRNGRTEMAMDHPLWYLLHTEPNPEMTSFTFRQTLQSHTCLWGNGYAEIQRDGAGRTVGLWPLLPDRTFPERRSDRSIVYRTNVDGRPIEMEPDDVLHIPGLGFDGLVGYSPIRMAREAVGLGLATEEFGARFFGNDAKSGGFLMHPGKLSEKAVANLKDDQDKQGGLSNAHRVKVLEEGLRFIPTTIPPDDSQFLQTRSFQLSEIARMFNVPLHMIQSQEGSTVWGTGIEQLQIAFVQFTIAPWVRTWEEEMNRKLFTTREREAGYQVKFNMNALLRGDMAARSAFYASGIQNGYMSRNQVRALEDWNAEPGLDEFLTPKNMQVGAEGNE